MSFSIRVGMDPYPGNARKRDRADGPHRVQPASQAGSGCVCAWIYSLNLTSCLAELTPEMLPTWLHSAGDQREAGTSARMIEGGTTS